MGGYGVNGTECKINITQKINHDGEVNRFAQLMLEPDTCPETPI
jgi:hypothetical protein